MKVFSIKKEKILIILYTIIIFIGILTAYNKEIVATFSMPVSKKIVLIDAGHGGFDPGKIADSDTFEKDINLQIAAKLQSYLEQGGSTVLMTRIEDKALSSEKRGDMWSRKNIANTSKADILVSIHQNSYPQRSVKGAQVFYFNESDNSKNLANCIQDEIKKSVDPYNKRVATANTNYYVLKQTTMPAVIVECGFLTNSYDKQRLESDKYQEQVAWGIYMGIVRYFDELDAPKK